MLLGVLIFIVGLCFAQNSPETISSVIQGCSISQRIHDQCDSIGPSYGQPDLISLGSQDQVKLPSDLFFQFSSLTIHAVVDGSSVTVGQVSVNGTVDGTVHLFLVLHVKGPVKQVVNFPMIAATNVSSTFSIETKCVSYYLYDNSLEMFPSMTAAPAGRLEPSINPSRLCFLLNGDPPTDDPKQNGGCKVLLDSENTAGGYSMSLNLDFDGDSDSCKDKTLVIVLAVVIPVVVLIAVGVMIGVFFWFKKNEKPIEEIELQRTAIEGVVIKNKIGAGAFGEVYIGSWQGTDVACKKLKDKSKMEEFVREAATLTKLTHPHIVQYLGVFHTPEKEKYIVTEFMTRGALDTLLRTEKDGIRAMDLIGMARHAALAMVYLAQRNIIHRDLSLRNFLVTMRDGKFQVKLSDFGLSRQLDKETGKVVSNETKIPVKWTAPEAIEHGTYSHQSDVWSFGIVMWELFSYSKLPYPGMSNAETIEQVSKGYRMPPPENTPDFIVVLMMRTWSADPEDRPLFSEILDILSDDTNKITPDVKVMDEPPTSSLVDMNSMDNYSYTPGDQQNIYNTAYNAHSNQPQEGIYNTAAILSSDPNANRKTEPTQNNSHYQALSTPSAPRQTGNPGKQEVETSNAQGDSHYEVLSDLAPNSGDTVEHYM